MNTLELKQTLVYMASHQTVYSMDFCNDIINVIIRYYLISLGYYENHAINTFKNFLLNGTLNFIIENK